MLNPSQYIEVRDSFFYSSDLLTKKREKHFKEVSQFLRSQFQQEFFTASNRYTFDESTRKLFNETIKQNVRTYLPKLLARKFALSHSDLITRVAILIRSELVKVLPQMFPANVEGSFPEISSLARDRENSPTRTSPDPSLERKLHMSYSEAHEAGESFNSVQFSDVYDVIISRLKEEEECLTAAIFQKKEEVEELVEVLEIESPEQYETPSAAPENSHHYTRIIDSLPLDEQKKRRIKNMKGYIKKRSNELEALSEQSRMLKKRLFSEFENEIMQQDQDVDASVVSAVQEPVEMKEHPQVLKVQALNEDARKKARIASPISAAVLRLVPRSVKLQKNAQIKKVQ